MAVVLCASSMAATAVSVHENKPCLLYPRQGGICQRTSINQINNHHKNLMDRQKGSKIRRLLSTCLKCDIHNYCILNRVVIFSFLVYFGI